MDPSRTKPKLIQPPISTALTVLSQERPGDSGGNLGEWYVSHSNTSAFLGSSCWHSCVCEPHHILSSLCFVMNHSSASTIATTS